MAVGLIKIIDEPWVMTIVRMGNSKWITYVAVHESVIIVANAIYLLEKIVIIT